VESTTTTIIIVKLKLTSRKRQKGIFKKIYGDEAPLADLQSSNTSNQEVSYQNKFPC